MRDQTKERIVDCAKGKSVDLITLEIAEDGIAESRKAMAEMIERDSKVD